MPYFMIFFSKEVIIINGCLNKKDRVLAFTKKANYYGLFAVVYKV